MPASRPGSAQENDVGIFGDELQAEKVLHLEAVEFLGPVPEELVEGLEDGETRRLQSALDPAVLALEVLALD